MPIYKKPKEQTALANTSDADAIELMVAGRGREEK